MTEIQNKPYLMAILSGLAYGEPSEVSAIATAAWTDAVKDAWKAKLIADKPSS